MKKYIITVLALVACSGIYAAGPKPPMSPMTVGCTGINTPGSITLSIGAGATGAPAGFSIMWMKQSDLDALGGVWPSDESMFCAASYSGVPTCSQFNIPPNGSVQITISDNLPDLCGISSTCNTPLECDTAYAFRIFAHANNTNSKGPFTITTSPCSTAPCAGGGGGCTLTQGYWKNHLDAWPVNILTLGTVNYDSGDLLGILNASPGHGGGANGLLILAHQLIATKLNIASGADATSIQSAVNAADAMIGSLVIPPLGTGFLSSSSTSTLVGQLDDYNNGVTGPGHCPP
jgi:hypothetical protein